jgi:hypothetical protein
MTASGYQRERMWEPGADWQRNKSGLYLPGEQTAPAVTDLVAIDLFAGAPTPSTESAPDLMAQLRAALDATPAPEAELVPLAAAAN